MRAPAVSAVCIDRPGQEPARVAERAEHDEEGNAGRQAYRKAELGGIQAHDAGAGHRAERSESCPWEGERRTLPAPSSDERGSDDLPARSGGSIPVAPKRGARAAVVSIVATAPAEAPQPRSEVRSAMVEGIPQTVTAATAIAATSIHPSAAVAAT